MKSKLIQINPLDNILVVREIIYPSDVEMIGDTLVVFENIFRLGHKIAAQPILQGEKIIKFGVPIGSATEDIAVGTHVHLHNMKSDYIATYTRDSEFTKSK